MQFNIIKKTYNIFCKGKNILFMYFTSFPNFLYNVSNRNGNMAYAGIGLGLINAQILFWISNLGITIFIYNKNNLNFFYMNYFLLLLCIFLYIISFSKSFYLINFLEINNK